MVEKLGKSWPDTRANSEVSKLPDNIYEKDAMPPSWEIWRDQSETEKDNNWLCPGSRDYLIGTGRKQDCSVSDRKKIICHICNTSVPAMHVPDHYNSAKHEANRTIADTAIDRMKNQMQALSMIDRVNNDISLYYCEHCSIAVKVIDRAQHENTLKHLHYKYIDESMYHLSKIYSNGHGCEDLNEDFDVKTYETIEHIEMIVGSMEEADGANLNSVAQVSKECKVFGKQTSEVDKTVEVNVGSVEKVNGENLNSVAQVSKECKVFDKQVEVNVGSIEKSVSNVFDVQTYEVDKVGNNVECILDYDKAYLKSFTQEISNIDLLYCTICDVLVLKFVFDIEFHMQDTRHIAIFNELLKNNFIRIIDSNIYCRVCNEYIEDAYLHIYSYKHMQMMLTFDDINNNDNPCNLGSHSDYIIDNPNDECNEKDSVMLSEEQSNAVAIPSIDGVENVPNHVDQCFYSTYNIDSLIEEYKEKVKATLKEELYYDAVAIPSNAGVENASNNAHQHFTRTQTKERENNELNGNSDDRENAESKTSFLSWFLQWFLGKGDEHKQNKNTAIEAIKAREIKTNEDDLNKDDERELYGVEVVDKKKNRIRARKKNSDSINQLEMYAKAVKALYNSKCLIQVDDDIHVTIETGSCTVLNVHTDNFHGFYKCDEPNDTICTICNTIFGKMDELVHIYTKRHMDIIAGPLNHCMREVDAARSHCIVCNTIINTEDITIHIRQHHVDGSILDADSTSRNDSEIETEADAMSGDETSGVDPKCVKATKKLIHPKITRNMLYCTDCKIDVLVADKVQHLMGKKHKKNTINKKGSNVLLKSISNTNIMDEEKMNFDKNPPEFDMSWYIQIVSELTGDSRMHLIATNRTVIINVEGDDFVKVSQDNFLGIDRTGRGLFCVVCAMYEVKLAHVYDEQHMRMILSPINGKDCLRKINDSWCHCFLCNIRVEYVETREHVSSNTNHQKLFKKAYIGKMSGTIESCASWFNSLAYSDIPSVRYLFQRTGMGMQCAFCNSFVSDNKDAVYIHCSSTEHNKSVNKVLKKNSLVNIEGKYFCGVCNVYLSRNGIVEHVNGQTHSSQLVEDVSSDDDDNYSKSIGLNLLCGDGFCGICHQSVGARHMDAHVTGKRHAAKLNMLRLKLPFKLL